MGRLERRKGLTALVAALRSLERDDWRLTILGGDTDTGPLGVSVRGQLELAVVGDERIEFVDSVPRERVLELVDEHDVVLVPSRWECWPNVALEAFERGRPILGTPTGGLVEMVKPGRSGIVAAGTGVEELAAGLDRVLDGELDEIPVEEPRRVFEELTDPEPITSAYLGLIPDAAPSPSPQPRPLVSVVVTYYRLADYIAEAIESLVAQTYPELQIVVVNDGSFEPEDEVLAELAERHPIEVVAQPNAGLSEARNLGVSLSLGNYILPFDADNVAGPRLVERLVTALEGDRALAYATSWSDFIDERGRPWREDENGYQPLGNWSRLLDEENVAGDATALIRREVFDSGIRYDPELTSYEDWHLYRRLWAEGLVGHVVPERLYSYRVRRDSMLRTVGLERLERQRAELAAHLVEAGVEWTRSG
jgi:glycogen(starch) synthase